MLRSSSTTDNFRLCKNLIIIDCEINESVQPFIFDTGAPYVVLNSKYVECDSLGYKGVKAQGATGEITDVKHTTIKNLSFGEIRKNNINALTMDLSHLERKLKSPIYGLIGYDFFKDLDVYIDYQERKLGHWSHSKIEKCISNNHYEAYDFEMEKHLPIIQCKMGDVVYNFALDTGANTNLINLELEEELQEFIEEIDESQSITGSNKESKEIVHPLYKLKSLEIDKLGEYFNMDVMFSNIDHLNHDGKIVIDGILGYEFLSQYIHIISYSGCKLYRMKI